MVRLLSKIAASSFLFQVAAAGLCPILGPVFPVPQNLKSSSSFQSALKTLESTIDENFATGNSTHGPYLETDTYSIQVFSASEGTLFDYYNTGANLVNETVDGDTIYRVASLSKLVAVYLLLIEAGDIVLKDPITKYLPELAGKAHFDEITVGALAGQVSGIVSDLYNVDSIAGGGLGVWFPGVFPDLEKSETSPCIANVTLCNRRDTLDALLGRRFTYLPNTTPAYSNAAFLLVGYVVETVTGKTLEEVLNSALIQPLGLTGTTASIPSDSSKGAILHNKTYSGWDIDLSDGTAMGGIFMSANDITTMGRAILNSTLLPPNTTRAWLKPTSFTSSLLGSVGMPWEIFRSVQDAANNRVVDIYTKSGNIGVYASVLAVVPDYNVGFTALLAGDSGSYTFGISGTITDVLLPAVEAAAREEAHAIYAGTFTATNGLNSSITLSTAPGKPGLGIERWFQNSTDVLSRVFAAAPSEVRVQPSNVEVRGGRVVGWRAVPPIDLGYRDVGAFSACPTWVGVDRPTWGIWGLDDFVFRLGGDGRAESLEVKALKLVLERV